MLLFAAKVSAQTECDYYKGEESVTAGGTTYNIKYDLSVYLQNADNTRCDEVNWYYKDGRMLETESEYNRIKATTNPEYQSRAIREAFGDIQIDILRRYNRAPLIIFYVVGSDGSTLEVAFIMEKLPELVSIPPDRFARLETLLKKHVTWDVNEAGQQLKFLHVGGQVNFNNIPTSDELISIEKNDDALGADLVPIE